ncbi:hypothetical protein SAMN05421593_0860 [Chryseobacterium culicis]|uniref:Uncharacterized protein n=1 Tax=Chryseobacterium culicis TaxID=680127 RepID=A0A1H6H006_CHRCI|nr:hypothetical protein SAMN05421593_0860 [Chryseobacterium culicis]
MVIVFQHFDESTKDENSQKSQKEQVIGLEPLWSLGSFAF